jgi:hypothetical protein
MPTTLRNTDILFNDGTTQSTAATAGGLVTTANVLNATAGASAGAVGTYMFGRRVTSADLAFGSTVAGSDLRPQSANRSAITSPSSTDSSFTDGPAQSGTWRAMGTYTSAIGAGYVPVTGRGATLWLRIS